MNGKRSDPTARLPAGPRPAPVMTARARRVVVVAEELAGWVKSRSRLVRWLGAGRWGPMDFVPLAQAIVAAIEAEDARQHTDAGRATVTAWEGKHPRN